jgi:predicted transposase YbfD/YdcC
MLAQEAVDEKSNEINAILAFLERIDVKDPLVSIDAMRCNPGTTHSILAAEADYLLAVKDNQPTLHADIKNYFETASSGETERFETIGKERGRLEIRTHTVSHNVDGIASGRFYPGHPLCKPRDHCHDQEQDRARRQGRERAAKSMGYQEQPALDARRDV